MPKDDVAPGVLEFVTPRVHGDLNRYPFRNPWRSGNEALMDD